VFSFAEKDVQTRYSHARTALPKSAHEAREMIYANRIKVTLNGYKQRCDRATLLEFRTAGIGGFGGPILMDDHVLIAVECATARGVVYLGICIQGVARRRGCHGENVSVLLTD
jgi:hypothetical protein